MANNPGSSQSDPPPHLSKIESTSSDSANIEPERESTSPSSPPSSTTLSSHYVYPVRSLLSGIQPAQDPPPLPGIVGAIGGPPTIQSMNQAYAILQKDKNAASRSLARKPSSASSDTTSKDLGKETPFIPLSTSTEGYFPTHSRKRSSLFSPTSPNSTGILPEEEEKEREDNNFSTAATTTTTMSTTGKVQQEPENETNLPTSRTEDERRVLILPSGRDSDEYDPRHPEPISSVGASDFITAYTNPALRLPKAVRAEHHTSLTSSTAGINDNDHDSVPLDFSKTGIVHLPPLPSRSGSERSSSARSRAVGTPSGSLSSGAGRGGSTSSRNVQSPISGSGSDARSGSRRGGSARFSGGSRGGGGSRRAALTSGSDSAGRSGGERTDRTRMSSELISSSSELVTFRFEHVEDENGFHVITGREGTLTRCEDEPIHAPGAVQGFGVLIAVEEDDETGNLIVRQVSENATELLGLSPKYLFGLECFTQTLPDSQADLLWDNVQFLNDSEISGNDSSDVAYDNPQVFLLSGWGEPGSAASDEEDEREREGDRRFWSCWCAAHRPPYRIPSEGESSQPSFVRNMIILELELERDLYNPLYPPFDNEAFPSGSPESQRSSSTQSSKMSSGSSTATTYSKDSGGSTELYTPLGPVTSNATPTNEPTSFSTPISTSPENNNTQPTVINPAELFLSSKQGLDGDEKWFPSPEDIFESTTSHSKPLKALERMRRISRTLSGSNGSSVRQTPRQRARARRGSRAGVGTMDIFAILAQVNDQLSSTNDLDTFLKVVVGVVKDLTQFHRVLVYQFDDQWNGQVVSELVDWRQTHDLYKGLHFPATDIPAQARELYKKNKVRLLYNRSQSTARLVVRSYEDLNNPLDMTHSFLRSMSPIHIKYLANMGVRSSMSISIVTFGALWGLISCHSYGLQGMRVSFPVRQMLRLLSDSVSRNIERLSYAQRLHTRKLISTLPTDSHPTGYIVSNAEDLLGLFDADFGVLVIGEGAKILGPNEHGQEILLVAEYLRLKQFTLLQCSQSVVKDFPDLHLPSGLEVIAGLLCVPLSRGGKDFIAFLRKGQLRDVHWAGKPYKDENSDSILEPRKSFKTWSETIAGRCRAWTEEQLETAGVLALVYGKFIEVWRQKESALQTTQLTNILLSNASHEVRTPLNHIINYLEMALNGPLDKETRENLRLSHSASKSLLFTINDLLDLARLESGGETSFNEPFNLRETITDAIQLYKNEAKRRNIDFDLDLSGSPHVVIGDAKKIRTVVANLTANAVKFTTEGKVSVSCHKFSEPRGLRNVKEVAVEIAVGDTGCGIEPSKLENIFREFEQVESSMPRSSNLPGLGLGLAVVARIVEQLGGQLRVDSKPGEGSRFSFLIPFELSTSTTGSQKSISPPLSASASATGATTTTHTANSSSTLTSTAMARNRTRSTKSSDSSEIDSLVEAISSDPMQQSGAHGSSGGNSVRSQVPMSQAHSIHQQFGHQSQAQEGTFSVADSRFPIKSLKLDEFDVDKPVDHAQIMTASPTPMPVRTPPVYPGRGGVLAMGSIMAGLGFKASGSPGYKSSGKGGSSPSSSSSSVSPGKLRVLVVEDDHINRSILSKRLSLDGHTVVETVDGRDCVEVVKNDMDFDCILMDIQMPILNGFEASKAVRSIEDSLISPAGSPSPTPSAASSSQKTVQQGPKSVRFSKRLNGRIPIFAVSASLLERQRGQMIDYGMDGWILKPIVFDRLRAILSGILDPSKREEWIYKEGKSWEEGGWFRVADEKKEYEEKAESSGSEGKSESESDRSKGHEADKNKGGEVKEEEESSSV